MSTSCSTVTLSTPSSLAERLPGLDLAVTLGLAGDALAGHLDRARRASTVLDRD